MVFVTTHDVEKLNLPTKSKVTVTHFHFITLLLFLFQARSHYILCFDINEKPEKFMCHLNYPVI